MEKATDFGMLICITLTLISLPLWVIATELEHIRKKMKP